MEARPEAEDDGFSDSHVMEFDVTMDSWGARKDGHGQVRQIKMSQSSIR